MTTTPESSQALTMQALELFDMDALRFILNNSDYYDEMLKGEVENGKPLWLLYKFQKDYVQKENRYAFVANYRKYHDKFPTRWTPNGGLSLACMHRPIRGSLAGVYYHDIDMVNAHPVIILYLCKDSKLKLPLLKEYCEDRAEFSRKYKYDLGEIKTDIIKLLNNGSDRNGKYEDIHKEIKKIHRWVKTSIGKDYYESLNPRPGRSKINYMGKTMSYVMCKLENEILMEMLEFFQENNIAKEYFTLCYDGIMILKEEVAKSNFDIDTLLEALMERINSKWNGINMKLKSKPFTTLPLLTRNDIESKEAEPRGFIPPLIDDSRDSGISTIVNIEAESHDSIPLPSYIPLYKKLSRFDVSDDMSNYEKYMSSELTWEVFKEYMGGCFPSYVEMESIFMKYISHVMFYCTKGNFYVIKLSSDDMFYVCKDIPVLPLQYTDIIVLKSGSVKTRVTDTKLRKLIDIRSWEKFIPSYMEMGFMPNRTPPRVFNKWRGFRCNLLSKDETIENEHKIKPILDFINEVWCDNQEDHMKYLLSWFNHIFTKPNIKTKIAVGLYSQNQQVGKGVFINKFLIPFIFGDLALSVAGLDRVTGRFNSLAMDKILINCDELSGSNNRDFHAKFDLLKNLITEPYMSIELKYREALHNYPNLSNYIFCTNNHNALKLETGDCRYFMLNCSDKYRGNSAFFNDLVNKFTQENADIFFSYCFHYEEIVDLKNIPVSEYRIESIISSMSSCCRFIHDLNDNYDMFKENPRNTADIPGSYSGFGRLFLHENGLIRASDLYESYKNWCDINREKTLSNTLFGREIKSFIVKKRMNYGYLYDINTIKF